MPVAEAIYFPVLLTHAEPYAVQTDLIQAYDEVEALTSTLCAGCLKTVSPGEGSLARCSLCLTAR